MFLSASCTPKQLVVSSAEKEHFAQATPEKEATQPLPTIEAPAKAAGKPPKASLKNLPSPQELDEASQIAISRQQTILRQECLLNASTWRDCYLRCTMSPGVTRDCLNRHRLIPNLSVVPPNDSGSSASTNGKGL